MHRLLERQLKKSLGRTEGFDQAVQWFIEAVQDAYVQSDEDRAMLERSMELSSRELLARNGALAEAEKKYRTIFENATEGIFQIAPEGYLISANPAMAEIFGFDEPDTLMAEVRNFPEQICIDASRREEFMALLKRDGMVSQFESQARRKDGSLIWVATSLRPARDNAGQIINFEGILRDTTKRKQADAERQEMQSHMLALSRQAGMAEVATGVLHNVGNVLNSVNVSASLACERLRNSKLSKLGTAIAILREHEADVGTFLTSDEKGKQLPTYLARVAEHLLNEQAEVLKELGSLVENLEHVKKIVTMQQSYAKASGMNESVHLPDLIEDAIRLNASSFERHQIEIVRQLDALPPTSLDKHRVLQILINLISNARHALREHKGARTLTICVRLTAPDRFVIEVRDSGIGIAPENLTRIFSHGFTTKSNGHGFGLHSSALAAKTMGGSLTAHSDGPGTGATFALELPLSPAEAAESEAIQTEKAA